MKVKLALILWLLRVTAPVTLIALVAAVTYVLFRRAPFVHQDFVSLIAPWLFVALHSVVLVAFVSRVHTSGFAYLYSRGFSRDTVWLNQMTASALAVLVVWLPSALCVWTGLRSALQEHLMQNSEYPVMAPTDTPFPWFYLMGYAIALPTLQYAWVRRNQPTLGQESGDALIVGIVLATFSVLAMTSYREGWAQAIAIAGGIAVGLTFVVTARSLHRGIEVQR